MREELLSVDGRTGRGGLTISVMPTSTSISIGAPKKPWIILLAYHSPSFVMYTCQTIMQRLPTAEMINMGRLPNARPRGWVMRPPHPRRRNTGVSSVITLTRSGYCTHCSLCRH